MDRDLFVAKTQRNLAYLYYALFALVLLLLLIRPPMVDEFGQAILQSLLGGLIVLCTQQSGYFFARQRGDDNAPQNPKGENEHETS